MTRIKLINDPVPIRINKSTRNVLKDIMLNEGIGTFDEVIQILARRKYHREYQAKRKNFSFKGEILSRDGWRCVLCNNPDTRRYPLIVHHKDWIHENDVKENCISLCALCHSRVHKQEIIV